MRELVAEERRVALLDGGDGGLNDRRALRDLDLAHEVVDHAEPAIEALKELWSGAGLEDEGAGEVSREGAGRDGLAHVGADGFGGNSEKFAVGRAFDGGGFMWNQPPGPGFDGCRRILDRGGLVVDPVVVGGSEPGITGDEGLLDGLNNLFLGFADHGGGGLGRGKLNLARQGGEAGDVAFDFAGDFEAQVYMWWRQM